VTSESFAEAWPERSGAFANTMNAMLQHVVNDEEHTTTPGPKVSRGNLWVLASWSSLFPGLRSVQLSCTLVIDRVAG
jgi:hypothetical protein